ncbi:MAG: hypothetical protein H0V72_00335 [Bradyrhizobium sp.]|nr:hypothetical protein [Bradyrhizobium sp.]
MVERRAALNNLAVGDIFHAECPNGSSLICLAAAVTKTIIQARTVTTQKHLEFDRRTGIAELGDELVLCTVDSVAPLPADIHNAVLGIDRKFRLEQEPERLKLSASEKRALLYIDPHYASNRV